MKTDDTLILIQQYQGYINSLQAMLTARMAAAADVATQRATAPALHLFQVPSDAGNPNSRWALEEAAHGNDPETLWAQPEHAYWQRAASDAIKAGVYDPVTP